MNVQERLHHLIDQHETRLHRGVPVDREAALLALIRALDWLPPSPAPESQAWLGLVTTHRLTDLGASRALQLSLESVDDGEARIAATPSGPAGQDPDGWGARVLQECGRLAEAEMVLDLGETGFLRIVDDGNGTFDAWLAQKGSPASWREREDIEWWAALLARQHEPELHALRSGQPDSTCSDAESGAHYCRLADVHLEMMVYQLGYPLDTAIGGCPIRIYRDVLRQLIAWALRERERGEAIASRSERSLVAALASALAIDPALVGRVVVAFTLDRENAAYHAAVPGIATAPLVRVAPDRLVWSLHGLTTQPLLFMLRELRRRDPQGYHNTAYLREAVFRQDLYALFQDKRFVTSPARIELRRPDGGIRTDIDAIIFDRKTGTLATFELKSQDPFARSPAELARRRDNVLYANRQVSAMLDWLQRFGADEILNRVDHRTARTFRVQRVLPFVLARFLVHFDDGPKPDRRAAWGSWPQLLRFFEGRSSDANPLASLFTRLTSEASAIPSPDAGPPREITIGDARLFVHPSYAAYQSRPAASRLPRP